MLRNGSILQTNKLCYTPCKQGIDLSAHIYPYPSIWLDGCSIPKSLLHRLFACQFVKNKKRKENHHKIAGRRSLFYLIQNSRNQSISCVTFVLNCKSRNRKKGALRFSFPPFMVCSINSLHLPNEKKDFFCPFFYLKIMAPKGPIENDSFVNQSNQEGKGGKISFSSFFSILPPVSFSVSFLGGFSFPCFFQRLGYISPSSSCVWMFDWFSSKAS